MVDVSNTTVFIPIECKQFQIWFAYNQSHLSQLATAFIQCWRQQLVIKLSRFFCYPDTYTLFRTVFLRIQHTCNFCGSYMIFRAMYYNWWCPMIGHFVDSQENQLHLEPMQCHMYNVATPIDVPSPHSLLSHFCRNCQVCKSLGSCEENVARRC